MEFSFPDRAAAKRAARAAAGTRSASTEIGVKAFAGCTDLESFTGQYASEDNRSLIVDGVLKSFAPAGLTTYTIPSTVETIGESAFFGCSGLTSVVIPSSVTSIETEAFYGCTGLTEIVSLNTTPPTVGTNAFYSVPTSTCVLKVPGESVDTYKKDPAWAALFWNTTEALPTVFALTDAADYTQAYSLPDCSVSYTRTVTSANWMGVCLPFDLDYSDWSMKGKAAILSEAKGETLDWTTLESGSTIAAGTPFIFKPNGAGEVKFEKTGATLNSKDVCGSTPGADYTLYGTFETKTDMQTSGAYALSGNAFRQAYNDSQTLKPYRVYIKANDSSSPAPALRCRINGEDATGIESLYPILPAMEGESYNLHGVRVDDSYKGIVIVNGKKVLRK